MLMLSVCHCVTEQTTLTVFLIVASSLLSLTSGAPMRLASPGRESHHSKATDHIPQLDRTTGTSSTSFPIETSPLLETTHTNNVEEEISSLITSSAETSGEATSYSPLSADAQAMSMCGLNAQLNGQPMTPIQWPSINRAPTGTGDKTSQSRSQIGQRQESINPHAACETLPTAIQNSEIAVHHLQDATDSEVSIWWTTLYT